MLFLENVLFLDNKQFITNILIHEVVSRISMIQEISSVFEKEDNLM